MAAHVGRCFARRKVNTLTCVLVLFGLLQSLSVAAEPQQIPYDPASATWLFDAAGLVSRNDVLYTSPSVEPWEAMPVGGGDLSAMVRYDGENLHLHLTKSDAWGFQTPPDAPLGTRFFNNVSPGHIRITLGDRARNSSNSHNVSGKMQRSASDVASCCMRCRSRPLVSGAQMAPWIPPSTPMPQSPELVTDTAILRTSPSIVCSPSA